VIAGCVAYQKSTSSDAPDSISFYDFLNSSPDDFKKKQQLSQEEIKVIKSPVIAAKSTTPKLGHSRYPLPIALLFYDIIRYFLIFLFLRSMRTLTDTNGTAPFKKESAEAPATSPVTKPKPEVPEVGSPPSVANFVNFIISLCCYCSEEIKATTFENLIAAVTAPAPTPDLVFQVFCSLHSLSVLAISPLTDFPLRFY